MENLQVDEQCRTIIVRELLELGLKIPKSSKNPIAKQQQDKIIAGVLYGRQLQCLLMVAVDAYGLLVQIPRFLFDALEYLREHLDVEGLFRKAGSISRQKELKRNLENGGTLKDADVQDVACLVKQFLRELTEPLLVRRLHDAFVGVSDLGHELIDQRRTLQLLCLLLPVPHLHILRYLMLFFSELVRHNRTNKMTVSNLAVVLTPNILVASDEPNYKEKHRNALLQKQMGIVQLLILNADSIGLVPEELIEHKRPYSTARHASVNDVIDAGGRVGYRDPIAVSVVGSRKKNDKKRHSINDVFNELRRMVRPIRHPYECTARTLPLDDISPLSTPPSVSTKRKHGDDTTAQWSSSKNSPVFLRRALMQASSLDVPVAVPPQPHFDSPDPVCREDAVSLTPGDDLNVDHKRKSGRLRIFSKGVLRRRNSSVRTPKAKKKTPIKRQINCNDGSLSLTSDSASTVPVFSLSASPALYLTRARRQEPDIISPTMVVTSLLQSNLKMSPTKCPQLVRDPVRDNHFAEKSNSALKLMPEKVKTMDSRVKSKEVTKVGSIRRTRVSKENDENKNVNNVGFASRTSSTSPPVSHFTRSTNGGSTLRRGRPNTVRSGLPKTLSMAKMSSYDSPCPLLVDPASECKVTTVIPKMDVFELELPDDEEEIVKFASSTTLDKDVDKSFNGDRKSRRSISLTDIFDNVADSLNSPGPDRSTSWEQLMGSTGEGNGDVFLPNEESTCDVETDVQWSRATVVLRDLHMCGGDGTFDIESHGRPSLIRLKKEKAGMVSASVKRFNDVIAKAVMEPVPEIGRRHSLRIASPVRIPPIFATPKAVGPIRLSSSAQSNVKRKQLPVEKSKVKPRRNSQTNANICSSRRSGSRSSHHQSPILPSRSSPCRWTTPASTHLPKKSKNVAAVRRSSPRFCQHSSLKAKAASDAYRRRAIRGQVKRRSTVL